MGVGVMLGAGIYAWVGQAAMLSGNTVWISFLAASIVAGLTGLSYAELASFIPKAEGEYYYVNRAFGPLVAFLVTWLLLVAIVMIVTLQNITVVANVSNFSLLSTFMIINAAVVVLRYREPNADRPFKVPVSLGRLPVIPVLGVLSSLFMLLFVGWTATLVGTALVIVGLLLYQIPRWFRTTPPTDDSA